MNTVHRLIDAAADLTEFTRQELLGDCRAAKVARVRFAVMLVARQHGLTYPVIGRLLGDRDHTTIVHGVKRAKEIAAVDGEYSHLCKALAQVIPRFIPVIHGIDGQMVFPRSEVHASPYQMKSMEVSIGGSS